MGEEPVISDEQVRDGLDWEDREMGVPRNLFSSQLEAIWQNKTDLIFALISNCIVTTRRVEYIEVSIRIGSAQQRSHRHEKTASLSASLNS